MIEKPKKERRFLKALGRVGEILIQEVLIKIGSNLIKKIGGKKTLPSILFLLASLSLFAQYPATGNKQRLGYQTTGDGLVWRGRANDTVALKSSTINNAYFILDTVNNVLFNYIKTKGGWVFNNTDTVINNITVDTTSLSNRINLKLNISDTASMLIPYFKDSDTTSLNLTSRFAAKLNISDTASMLIPYFKDSDTTSLNLTSRFAAKLNISDTASMLTNYLRSGVAASTYQAKLNGTGFVKASGTTISYDNSTYLTTTTAASTYLTQSNAASTYLPLTGGTLTGNLRLSSSVGTQLNIDANDNNLESRITFSTVGSARTKIYTTSSVSSMTFESIAQASAKRGFRFISSTEGTQYIGLVQDPQGNVGIKSDATGNDVHPNTLYVNGTLGVTGATTLSAPLTVNSSAVFNEGSADADFRVESDANVNMVFVDASTDRVGIGTNAPTKTLDVNGDVRIGTTTATPTSLLGKDDSNVVGTVTTLAQTGLMKAGGTTTNTSSVGIITVPHGLSYTPTQVLVTLAQQNSYVIVCHGINSTNLLFTVYDSVTGNALNNVSVGFFWLAIK